MRFAPEVVMVTRQPYLTAGVRTTAAAAGVGTAVDGGLTYREAHLAMEMLADTRRVTSIEVVEVNPVLDTANRTALLAVELIMSAMGKRIL